MSDRGLQAGRARDELAAGLSAATKQQGQEELLRACILVASNMFTMQHQTLA